MKVRLLDCTLRDGGYVNDWNFGRVGIYNIFTRLAASGIDIVEVGFLNKDYFFDMGHSIMPRSSFLPVLFNIKTNRKPLLVAMVIMGECPIENVDLQSESLVDGIRVVFKKTGIDAGLDFAAQCKTKGYKVFLQPASVTDYSEDEMALLAERANVLCPEALYIVDTYGLMHKDKVFQYFHIMDKTLSSEISIGFHSHNNLQMSYSSAIDLLDVKTERELILDSSLFGMGKGPGNLNTELIVDYLNKYHGKQYDLTQILEAIDLEILKLKQLYKWGYSLEHFLAASNDCHPSYVKYLLDKKTLSIKSVETILSRLTGVKTLFNKDQIEHLYLDFQSNEIDDTDTKRELGRIFGGKPLLLLAPGASLNTAIEKIKDFIHKIKPIVISINHNPINFPVDYYFVNNSKRYSQMAEFLEQNPNLKMITTSNITPNKNSVLFMLNYRELMVPGDVDIVSGNAGLMLLNLLASMEISRVYIAGFDGFSSSSTNYADSYLSYNVNTDFERQNALIRESVTGIRKHLDIESITPSYYF